jgi:glycosyltransferase involved in cell wall biosynthesis
MRIAVNARFGAYPYEEGYGRFVREITSRLPQYGDADEYLFIYDQLIGPQKTIPPFPLLPGAGVSHRVIGPPAKHPLLWRLWYDLRVPAALRAFGASVFLSPDGSCSLTSRVPQVLVIHDLAFLHFPESLPRAQYRYYKANTPRCIRKAAAVVTVSAFSERDILQHYPDAKGKIFVVPNAAGAQFRPLSWQEREAAKDRFAEGKEYFVYTGSIHPRKNLINLLKAFSVFKKRQQTGMKLVLAGRLAWQHEDFTEALSRYKYRDDVVLTGFIPAADLAQLVGGAYAMVYPSRWEGFGLPLVEAMQSGVPVLCSGVSALPETVADAGLLFDPADPEDIARQMMRIFIDETERSRLIERGLERARLFSWDQSAKRMHEILHQAAVQKSMRTFAPGK